MANKRYPRDQRCIPSVAALNVIINRYTWLQCLSITKLVLFCCNFIVPSKIFPLGSSLTPVGLAIRHIAEALEMQDTQQTQQHQVSRNSATVSATQPNRFSEFVQWKLTHDDSTSRPEVRRSGLDQREKCQWCRVTL